MFNVFRSSSVSTGLLVGSASQGASTSSLSRPPLSKASTQLQLINERGGVAVRQLSMENQSSVKV